MIDNREAIEWFKKRRDSSPMAGARKMFVTAIAALEKQRWIPVTERLPENFQGVLAWIERNKWGDGDTPTKTQECAIGGQIDGSWHFDGYSGKGTRCIAWRPLPEPYKDDRK